MSDVDDYLRWLGAMEKQAQMESDALKRVADQHQMQAEQTIANLAALKELESDKLALAVLGNPQ